MGRGERVADGHHHPPGLFFFHFYLLRWDLCRVNAIVYMVQCRTSGCLTQTLFLLFSSQQEWGMFCRKKLECLLMNGEDVEPFGRKERRWIKILTQAEWERGRKGVGTITRKANRSIVWLEVPTYIPTLRYEKNYKYWCREQCDQKKIAKCR